MIVEKKLLDDLIYCKGLGRKSLEAVIEVIQRQPQVDKWIPCEERLPETLIGGKPISEEDYIKSRYLISDGENTHVAIWTQKGFRAIEDIGVVIEDVIAWQPLPQPYKPDHLGEVNGMVKEGE